LFYFVFLGNFWIAISLDSGAQRRSRQALATSMRLLVAASGAAHG